MIKNGKSHVYLTLSFLFLLWFNIFTIENLLISSNLLFNNEQIENLRTSGEIWFPPERLSIGSCSYPEIAIDNYGNIHLIWLSGYNIFYKFKNITSGNWTENEILSTGASSIATNPDIAIDCFGNIHTTWQNYTSSNENQAVFYKLKNITTGIWTPWEVLVIGSDTGSPAITTDHFGNLYLSFCYLDKIYMTRKSYNSNNWGSFESISSAVTFGSHGPSIVVDSSLNIYIAWHYAFLSPTMGISQIYFARWSSSSSSWSSPMRVSTGSFDGSWLPDITIDASGTLHVVWTDDTDLFNEDDDFSSDIFYRCRYPNGQWSSIKSLSDQLYFRGDYDRPKITIENDNNIHIVWNHYYRRFDINDNVWKDTVSFASHGRDPALVTGFDNQLHLTWIEYIEYSADLLYRKCIIDDAKPIINILGLNPYERYRQNPSYELIINETYLNTIWYTIYGNNLPLTTIMDIHENDTISADLWNTCGDGLVTIEFYANDLAGNIGTKAINLIKDTTGPDFIIEKINDGDIYSNLPPDFVFTPIDSDYNSSWYTINNNPLKFFIYENTSIDPNEWEKLLNGNVNLTFYANDSLGNIHYEEITIFKDLEAPNIEFEYSGIYLNPIYPEYYHSNLEIKCYITDFSNISWVYMCENSTGIYVNRTMEELEDGYWRFNLNISGLLWNSEFYLYFYAKDSFDHIQINDNNSSLYRIMINDFQKPIITINSPRLNQLCGIIAPSFSLTIDEINIQEMLYSFNLGDNITFTSETQFDQTEWDKVGNGPVLVTFYVIDKAGNLNSSEIIIRKDGIIPQIIINSPFESELFGNTPPKYDITILENNLFSMWYIIEGIIGNFSFNEMVGSIDQDIWVSLPQGEITITFYAQDIGGNIGTQSVLVIKRLPSQSSISGYNLFLLVGVLSVISLIIRRTQKKK